MLQLRNNKNLDLVMQKLQAANEFLDNIEGAIAKAYAKGLVLPPGIEGKNYSNYIYVSNLLYAFLTVFLIKDWERAKSRTIGKCFKTVCVA